MSKRLIGNSLRLNFDNNVQLQLKRVRSAFFKAAFTIRDNARSSFVSNSYGYRLIPLKDAIKLGTLKASNTRLAIAVHALGPKSDPSKELWKARLFMGGAYHRQTKNGAYRGSVSAIDSIVQSLNLNIINSIISNAINR